jgi:hypothetical protein
MVTGDLPRLGPKPGDPRCEDPHAPQFRPCYHCEYEQVKEYKYEGKVMPGLDRNNPAHAEIMGPHPVTGQPYRHGHPFAACTPEMNANGGCDTYGNKYVGGHRYETVKIHKWDEDKEEYVHTKTIELDFGPQRGSPEYEEELKKLPEDHPSRKPLPELVDPNPWLEGYVPKTIMEEHVENVEKWAAEMEEKDRIREEEWRKKHAHELEQRGPTALKPVEPGALSKEE